MNVSYDNPPSVPVLPKADARKSAMSGLVESRWFQRSILAVILLAGLLAGLETNQALLDRYGPILRALDWFVLVVFISEILVKILAQGRQPWRYFSDGWNVFDFTIVALCCLPLNSQFAAVLRLARGLRLLRLITALPKLQLLVGALLKSLGAMGYVSLLLALMFYIYGVAGVHLFGQHQPDLFGSLSAACLSLLRMVTLDNWSDIFTAVRERAPVMALVYFISFILLGTMIMLNLFIGIIMNSMSEMHAEIEEREWAQHMAQSGHPSLEDEINRLERQVGEFQEQIGRLRHLLRSGR